jgi:hypothetical protein
VNVSVGKILVHAAPLFNNGVGGLPKDILLDSQYGQKYQFYA